MMEPDEMQLAIAYAELPQSIAFQDFLKFQHEECERLELAALNADATQFETARTALIQWQQRRIVVRTLEETIRDSAAHVKSMQEENSDARPDRSGW